MSASDNHRLARAVAMNLRGLKTLVIPVPQPPPKPRGPNRKARRAMLAKARKRKS